MDESNDKTSQPQKGNIFYTVDEAIKKIGFGPFQVLITFFCGFLFLADAMEFTILSVLSAMVRCQWNLSWSEEALLTSLVFLGFLFGGLFWGFVAHTIGRRRGLLIADLFILLFGVLSALRLSKGDNKIPGYPWLLICRFGVGFGTGGIGQAVTYYIEFLPLKGRGLCITVIRIWWSIGTMFGAVLALGVIGEGGLSWHWYLGLSSIPLGLVLLVFPLVPESARFYLVKGKDDKAQQVIKRVAWFNCKQVPPGKVVLYEVKLMSQEKEASSHTSSENIAKAATPLVHDSQSGIELTAMAHNDLKNGEKRKLLDSKTKNVIGSLFINGMWKTTVVLACLWFGAAWLHYGAVLLTTTLLISGSYCIVNRSNESTNICEELDTNNYLKILWTAAAGLPGSLITIIFIETLGRKITLVIEFMLILVGFLLLFICASDVILTLFHFIIRTFTSGIFQTVSIYTAEVYPTNSRAIGMGVCTAAARVGAIATPYVAQILLHANDYATLSLYAGSSLVLAILAMLLPIETKGRALHDKTA